MNRSQLDEQNEGHVPDYLDSYVDNQLAPETHAEVSKHLTVCSSCSEELNAKVALKGRLRTAVQSIAAPPELRSRIQQNLRANAEQGGSHWLRGLTAIAAAIIICVASVISYELGHLRLTSNSQESYISSISQQVGSIMRIGLGDHVHCAVFRRFPKNPPSLQQMTQDMGPQYSDLISLVNNNVPKNFRVVMAHQCRYHGRRFVHVTATDGARLMSLVIARKSGSESFTNESLRPLLSDSGLPIYRSSVQRFEIDGFETREHLVYVVSDLNRTQSLEVMTALASGVRDVLRRIES
jgi:hypothetical protein